MDDTWAGERERPMSGVMQAWVTVNQATQVRPAKTERILKFALTFLNNHRSRISSKEKTRGLPKI
jgi:hypothetical protein